MSLILSISLSDAFARSDDSTPPLLSRHGPVKWTTNGHFYELVDASLTWEEANAAAQQMVYNGVSGHLASITSVEENVFLTNHPNLGGGAANLLHFHWIGGYQPIGSGEPLDGWSWTTGEVFAFHNWAFFPFGEPNNVRGNEDRIIFDHGINADGKMWNDINEFANGRGFVVEFPVSSVPDNGSCIPFLFILIGTMSFLRSRVSGSAV